MSWLAGHRFVVFWCVAVVSLVGGSPAGAVGGFGDVVEGEYYTSPVQWSADNDITGIEGGCFAPDAEVSRGEAAVYIWNMSDRPSAPAHSFVDVIDPVQDTAVAWMLDSNITTGTSETTFEPDALLTRAQVVTFLWRLAGEPDAAEHSFTDVVAGWQQGSVSWAAVQGITTGTSETMFSPDDTLTRAQLVTFLYRYAGEPAVDFDSDAEPCDPHTVVPSGTFLAVSAGGVVSCGLRTDSTVACWGSNDEGQTDAPDGVFQSVSTGYSHSCGVRADSTVVCWGSDLDPRGERAGQSDAPDGLFQSVSAGGAHTCGVRDDQTVACWGSDLDPRGERAGQSDAPDGLFQSVSAGGGHSCGLRDDQTVACWGWNDEGQTDAPEGAFQAVATGSFHSCALRDDQTVTCWGHNGVGQTDTPDGAFQAVAAGVNHTCGLRSDNTVTCWGHNGDSQTNAPDGKFQAVSAGATHSCGL